MEKIKSFINTFNTKYLSSSRQVQRIVVLAAIALVMALGSFAGYYWYTRYHSNQPDLVNSKIQQAEQALDADPTNLDKRLSLAETYMLYGHYKDALTQAEQVFAADATRDRSWLVIGVANNLLGKPSESIAPLTNFVDKFKDEKMAALDKALQEAVYYLGDSYLQLKDYDNAIKYLEMSVGWSQLDADALYKLGLAYKAAGRYEEAVNTLHLAVNFVPNFTEAYQAMAEAYDAGGRQGLGDYARGMLAYSKKDYKTALILLTKASEAYPKYAPVFSGLGLTYEAMNDLRSALVAFQTAVTNDPNDFTAVRGVERVTALINK